MHLEPSTIIPALLHPSLPICCVNAAITLSCW